METSVMIQQLFFASNSFIIYGVSATKFVSVENHHVFMLSHSTKEVGAELIYCCLFGTSLWLYLHPLTRYNKIQDVTQSFS